MHSERVPDPRKNLRSLAALRKSKRAKKKKEREKRGGVRKSKYSEMAGALPKKSVWVSALMRDE
jgi:hypothetical protein